MGLSSFLATLCGQDRDFIQEAERRRPHDELKAQARQMAARFPQEVREPQLSPRIRWKTMPFAFHGVKFNVSVRVLSGASLFVYANNPLILPSDVERREIPLETLNAVERIAAIPGIDAIDIWVDGFVVRKHDLVSWREIHGAIVAALKETIFAGCESVDAGEAE
jgi:hypothetical protein